MRIGSRGRERRRKTIFKAMGQKAGKEELENQNRELDRG